MKRILNYLYFILFFQVHLVYFAQGPLQVNAGKDTLVCPNISFTIRSLVSGGVPSYTYSWLPATGLNDATIARPVVTVNQTLSYTLTVTDGAGTTKTDVILIQVDDIALMGAGKDTGFCINSGTVITIGSTNNHSNPYTFNWTPIDDLSNPKSPSPIATPNVTTTYTLEITSPNCGKKTDEVTVNVYNISANAGKDLTITEGTTITLHATPIDPNYTYWWKDTTKKGLDPIQYHTTANPDVTPKSTMAYVVYIKDKHGCESSDSVTVFVIPENKPVFYTSFTPNNDGDNDTWYIGNCAKFEMNKLEIYNRYGQLVFSKSPYKNDWDGKYFGNELPAGTYFYIFDTRSELGKYKGSVTIVR